MAENRKRIQLPPAIQRTIFSHVMYYWAFFVFLTTAPLFLGMVVVAPQVPIAEHMQNFVARYWPMWATMACITPLLLKDAKKVANRIVGPLGRLQGQLERVNAGKDYQRVNLRQNDFMQDLIDSANRALGRNQIRSN